MRRSSSSRNDLAEGIRRARSQSATGSPGRARARPRVQLARDAEGRSRGLPRGARSHEASRQSSSRTATLGRAGALAAGSARRRWTSRRDRERPGSVATCRGRRARDRERRPLSFAANINLGIAATNGEYVLVANPDAVPEPGAVPALAAFADDRPRCGIAGPRMLWPDGSWQPSRRRFPTVARHARPAHAAAAARPTVSSTSASTTCLDERSRPSRSKGTGCSVPSCSCGERCSSELGGWDAGYRHYCEDIDLCYRAAKAGWERWYVPQAVVSHAVRGRDRPAVPLATHALAPRAAWSASSASIPRRCSRCDWRPARLDQYAPQGVGLVGPGVRRRRARTSDGAPTSSSSLGPPLRPGDEVLDLACGDGGLGEHLLALGLPLPWRRRDGRDGHGRASATRGCTRRSSRET